MKIRTGFVSNSSSASFVIKWKCYDSKSNKVDDIIDLFRCSEQDKICIESKKYDNHAWGKNLSLVGDVIKNTNEIDKGIYITTFFTAMLNEYSDFEKSLGDLLTVLHFDPFGYEIMHTQLESEHGF